jgi:mRNA-degrading endonuclease RelE of RelBE toxin-antitoxin system
MKTTNVIPTPQFKREAKPLLKKYLSLSGELRELEQQLKENAHIGDKITENTYKIRVAVKSKGKGKSGGLRVISYIIFKIVADEEIENVYLLAIYDKSEFENISDKLIIERIETVLEEFENDKK